MATQVCNNNGVGAQQKSKAFTFQSLLRVIKTACRNITKKTRKSPSCASVDDYEYLSIIGEGAYGAVFKVREKKTGKIMATKKLFGGPSPAAVKEIDILKSLSRHPSIVGFNGVARDKYGGIHIVMEYMETDLKSYIARKKKEGYKNINEVKKLMKQLLEGVKFMHKNGVMHRDLKPENILVTEGGDLKICDFGEAERFGKGKGPFLPYVGTLWYMAPEMLLGATQYSSEVDMWSVGCILAEMVMHKVLFEREDVQDQIVEIYGILGDPENPNDLSGVISSPKLVLTEDGHDLLRGLLHYDRRKRLTAKSALRRSVMSLREREREREFLYETDHKEICKILILLCEI